jgi:cyclophilin family peptidyl-prolyl cis-trans isomerase/type II secretory pathway pseudopilin PulG
LCTLVAVPRRTRNRQLARQAALRRAQKRQQQRKRQLGTIAVALVLALVGGVLIATFVGGGDGDPSATPTPDPTSSPSASPSGDPGKKTGTVRPEPGPEEVACGAEVPQGALRPKPQFNAPAQVIEDGSAYTATFETSCGDIVVELLADTAPETVNSFVFLAQEGYFDGTRIHRLDTSLDVIQGGDPVGEGTSGPGYTIPDELEGGETYGPGVFAMANSGSPNSGGSQFFLITGNNGHRLDANPAYTIFGTVIEGLTVAREIQALPIQDPDAAAAGDISGQQPAQAVYIEKVTIEVSGEQ